MISYLGILITEAARIDGPDIDTYTDSDSLVYSERSFVTVFLSSVIFAWGSITFYIIISL